VYPCHAACSIGCILPEVVLNRNRPDGLVCKTEEQDDLFINYEHNLLLVRLSSCVLGHLLSITRQVEILDSCVTISKHMLLLARFPSFEY
jgi:hypothetical protein